MSASSDPASPLRSRREFLRRTLRAGAYVPPTVVAMSMKNVALAQATCPDPKGMSGHCAGGPP